jgi:hypothetical protein
VTGGLSAAFSLSKNCAKVTSLILSGVSLKNERKRIVNYSKRDMKLI